MKPLVNSAEKVLLMDEKPNYFFEDFTFESYKELLRKTSHFYTFLHYTKSKDLIEQENKLCLWRHDVDFSVENAYKLSKIEKETGVTATYFFQLSSNFYNVFDPSIIQLIKKIIDNNHKIGLHFYPGLYKIENEKQLIEKLEFEKNIIEGLLNVSINVFSFHNPTEEITSYFDKLEYAGMINTYAREIKEKFAYCSDSNGYWRHKRLEDFLHEGHPRIQVLTHPVWWQETPMKPRERIKKQINDNSNSLLIWYDNILETFGRNNIGKI